jgi:hypothetical protein
MVEADVINKVSIALEKKEVEEKWKIYLKS